jgi:hypothetical protein
VVYGRIPTLSERERELIRRFQSTHPDYEVLVAPIFSGFVSGVGDPPLSHTAVSVRERTKGRSIKADERDVEWVLRIAELQITSSQLVEKSRYFDRDLITGFLPERLRELGWSCARAWAEQTEAGDVSAYHVRLRRKGHAPVEFSDYDFRSLFEGVVDEAERISAPDGDTNT